MTQLKRNQAVLIKYIPEAAVEEIASWIYKYDFKLKVKKSRATKYGDYRSPYKGKNHVITINHDMNKYAFLITLIHEVAHLCNYEEHKHSVKPHGIEWKMHYKRLMHDFLNPNVFPDDVISALKSYMGNPAASSCSDLGLMRVLKKYNAETHLLLLEDIAEGNVFTYNEKRHFTKGAKVRKRFKCEEVGTKRVYLFNPLAEVEVIESN